jgi:hypothetical protein
MATRSANQYLKFIKDQGTLEKAIEHGHQVLKKSNEIAHCITANVVLHAAMHGDPTLLQRWYDGIPGGMQGLMRQWLGAITNVRDEKERWLAFGPEKDASKEERKAQNGKFRVLKSTSEQRKTFSAKPERFFVRDVDGNFVDDMFKKDTTGQSEAFDTDGFIKRLAGLKAQAERAVKDKGAKIPAYVLEELSTLSVVAQKAQREIKSPDKGATAQH